MEASLWYRRGISVKTRKAVTYQVAVTPVRGGHKTFQLRVEEK